MREKKQQIFTIVAHKHWIPPRENDCSFVFYYFEHVEEFIDINYSIFICICIVEDCSGQCIFDSIWNFFKQRIYVRTDRGRVRTSCYQALHLPNSDSELLNMSPKVHQGYIHLHLLPKQITRFWKLDFSDDFHFNSDWRRQSTDC